MKHFKNRTDGNPASVVLRGLLTALGATLVLSALAALLVTTGIVNVKAIPETGAMVCALAALTGSWLAGKQAGSKKLFHAGAVGLGYLLLLLLGGLAFVPSAPAGFASILIAGLVGTLCAGLLAGRQPRSRLNRWK